MPQFDIYNSVQIAVLKGQLTLLPLYFFLFILPAKKVRLEYRVAARNWIALGSIIIPLILLLLPNFSHPVSRTSFAAATAISSTVDDALVIPAGRHVYQFSSAVSMISILLFAGLFLGQFIRERRLIAGAEKVRRSGRVKLVFSSKVGSPFSTGLFFVRIYFPHRFLNNKPALGPVLAHETRHVRKKHLWMDVIDKINIVLGWYNPLAYWLYWKGVELREFECDRWVVTRYSAEHYGQILINEAESLSRAGKWALSSAFINPSLLKRRFQMLFERSPVKRNKTIFILSVAALLFSGLLIAVFSLPKKANETPRPVELPGYAPKSGYNLYKDRQDHGIEYVEEAIDSRQGEPLKSELGGRSKEDVEKVLIGAMREVIKLKSAFFPPPPESGATIMRIDYLRFRLTIGPDGTVSSISTLVSTSDNGKFNEANKNLYAALTFGPNPKGKTAVVDWGYAFDSALIPYPPKN